MPGRRLEGPGMKKEVLLLLAWFLLLCGAAGAESVLAVSDAHMRADTDEFDAAFSAVLESAANSEILIMLGDNTNNGRPEEHALALERLHRIQTETGSRVFVIPGNHDYNAHFVPADFEQEYADYGSLCAFSRDRDTAGCAVMTESGICLLLLDTNRYDSPSHVLPDGGITENTLSWAEEVLSGLEADTPVIACGHHPILPESREARTGGAAQLAELFRKYGVTLYLCGHDHGFATAVSGTLRQITVGQAQAYPGTAGRIRREENGFVWTQEQIFAPDSRAYLKMREKTEALAVSMAAGLLGPTEYQGDEEAVAWFARAFMTAAGGEMNEEAAARLLQDENSRKWRAAQTRGVAKDWIFSLLEHCPEDMHRLEIPLRALEK